MKQVLKKLGAKPSVDDLQSELEASSQLEGQAAQMAKSLLLLEFWKCWTGNDNLTVSLNVNFADWHHGVERVQRELLQLASSFGQVQKQAREREHELKQKVAELQAKVDHLQGARGQKRASDDSENGGDVKRSKAGEV